MNAIAAREMGPSKAVAVSRLQCVWLALLCCAAPAALAFEGDVTTAALSEPALPQGDGPRAKLELSTSSLPRFDSADGASRSSRIDLTYLPPRRSALGLSLGMTSTDAAELPFLAPRPNAGPSVDLGVHWRYTPDGQYRLDVTAWRRLVPPDALTLVQTHEPLYGARVEMRIGNGPGNAVRSGFVAERGFFGLQLEGGARVTLRRSGGKPMVYYRTRF